MGRSVTCLTYNCSYSHGDYVELLARLWKRQLQAIIVVLPLLLPQLLFASDDFCGESSNTVTVYANIPVLRAGNLHDFLQTQNIDRLQSIEDFLQRTPEVAKGADANLSDVAHYLYALNDLHKYMLQDSSEGIGTLISERLRGEIDMLYFNENTQNRRISFRDKTTEEAGVDYAAYGSYTFIGEESVSITIKIIRLSDGETRTFVASGQPLIATKALAVRIFDAFQFPDRASITNPFQDKVWVGGLREGVGTKMRVSDAAEYCAALSAELPSKIDIMLANNLGAYVTGARIDAQETYVVIDSAKVSTFTPATGTCLPEGVDKTKTATVLCLQKLP